MKRFFVLYWSTVGVYPNERTEWMPWSISPIEAETIDALIAGINTSGRYRVFELADTKTNDLEVQLNVTERKVYDREVSTHAIPR